jgi:hypothetical protein
MSEGVIDDVIAKVKGYFGDLAVSRGKKHTFLGMNLVFNDDGSLQVETKTYIKEAIEAFGEDVSTKVSSPAKKKLFEINPDTPALDTKRADICFIQRLPNFCCGWRSARVWTSKRLFLSCAHECQRVTRTIG